MLTTVHKYWVEFIHAYRLHSPQGDTLKGTMVNPQCYMYKPR